MSDVSRIMGENVAKYRRRAGLTQKAMADQLSLKTDKIVSENIISAWERGITPIPSDRILEICHLLQCSSYNLYPYSARIDEKGIALYKLVMNMSERKKDILIHMLTKWAGDDDAFWEFGLLYMSLCEYRRQNISVAGIEEYKEARRADDIEDRTIPVDLDLIVKAWKALDK